jgi:predicted RNA-binding Zn-ribbon protein involved in translation (DUF1610 family)
VKDGTLGAPSTRTAEHVCPECERRHGAKTYRCHACRLRAYRKTESGRQATIRANLAYAKRNPDKVRVWRRNYQIRIGRIVPDLTELRRAIKSLDAIVEAAAEREGIRGSDQPRGHDGPARRD